MVLLPGHNYLLIWPAVSCAVLWSAEAIYYYIQPHTSGKRRGFHSRYTYLRHRSNQHKAALITVLLCEDRRLINPSLKSFGSMLITLVSERNSVQEFDLALCLIPSVIHVKHSNILTHNTKKSQVSATLKVRFTRCTLQHWLSHQQKVGLHENNLY